MCSCWYYSFAESPTGQGITSIQELRLRVAELEGEVELAEAELRILHQQSSQYKHQIAIILMRFANGCSS